MNTPEQEAIEYIKSKKAPTCKLCFIVLTPTIDIKDCKKCFRADKRRQKEAEMDGEDYKPQRVCTCNVCSCGLIHGKPSKEKHGLCKSCAEKDFEKSLKTKCINCLTPLTGGMMRFIHYGNFCGQCSTLADKMVKGTISLVQSIELIEERKQGNLLTD